MCVCVYTQTKPQATCTLHVYNMLYVLLDVQCEAITPSVGWFAWWGETHKHTRPNIFTICSHSFALAAAGEVELSAVSFDHLKLIMETLGALTRVFPLDSCNRTSSERSHSTQRDKTLLGNCIMGKSP